MPSANDVWKPLTPFLVAKPELAAAGELLSLFVKIVEESYESELADIKADLQRLIKSKFKSGKDLLEDAKSATSLERRRAFLNEARQNFVNAVHLEASPDDAAAMEYVGICHDLYGDTEQAKVWYKKAQERAHSNHSTAVADLNNCLSMGYLKVGVTTLLIMTIIFALPAAGLDVWKERKFNRQALIAFALESQLKHLTQVLARHGLSHDSFSKFFPDNVAVVEIYPGRHSSEYVRCYDSAGRTVKHLHHRFGFKNPPQ
jgi:tetratricopeptide (TPR) repeat protein